MRLALEQFEPEKDMEFFVANYSTGNAIPNPPAFVNYANPESATAASQRPASRPANFQRVTDRPREFFPPQPHADEEAEPPTNTAGIGAGGGRQEPPPSQSRPASRASSRIPPPSQGPSPTSNVVNGRGGGKINQSADPSAPPIAADENVMLKVGDRAWPVDPSNNPQDGRAGSTPLNGAATRVGEDDDPLIGAMMQLRSGASSVGSIRRPQQGGVAEQQPVPSRPTHQTNNSTSSQLSPPPGGRGGGPPNKADYRRSAEFVVGGPPPTNSRPTSPKPPTAVFAQPPPQQQDPTVQNMLQDYQQSFPGERKSISRPGSRAGSFSTTNAPPAQPQQPAQRPESMAGVGAQGRSPSPQPFRPPSRVPSPMQQLPQARGITPNSNRNVSPAVTAGQLPPQNAPQQAPLNGRQTSVRAPYGSVGTPFTQANNGVGPGHQSRQSSISTQGQRPVSPNPVGIQLDRNGRVVGDELAEQYARGYQAPAQQPAYAPVQQQSVPRGYGAPPTQAYSAPQQPRAAGYPAQTQFAQQVPPPQAVAPPPQQPGYGQQYGQYDYGYPNAQPPPPQPLQQQPYYPNNGAVQPYQQYPAQHRAPSPRAPSPQPPANQQPSPTGAYTDDGRPILFYGKVLLLV